MTRNLACRGNNDLPTSLGKVLRSMARGAADMFLAALGLSCRAEPQVPRVVRTALKDASR